MYETPFTHHYDDIRLTARIAVHYHDRPGPAYVTIYWLTRNGIPAAASLLAAQESAFLLAYLAKNLGPHGLPPASQAIPHSCTLPPSPSHRSPTSHES